MDAKAPAVSAEVSPSVAFEMNGQAAQLLMKLMADLGTDQPMAVLTRALGMLEQGLAARQRGQRLGIYDPGSQRFTDVVV